MKRYFVYPEIKISSAVLLSMIALFMLVTIFVLGLQYESLMDNYTKTMGAVAVRVIEKNPSMKQEIMPLITSKISEKEAAKGKYYLNQYGLNNTLDVSLFPYINTAINKTNIAMITIFAVMALVLFVLNYFQFGFFYEKIRKLTLGAKKVIDGDYDISIGEDREGDLSKLSNSFNSMKQIIRNNIMELKTEKQFLIDLLSDISHQLKTPLSSMIVYNDILLSKELTSEQRGTFLLSTKNQLYRMNWLIRNLLKLAKLDAKAIILNIENQCLNETIQESIDIFENKAMTENIKINFIESKKILFNHDRLWLEEALNNIIKNAIEHTALGGVINIEVIENPIYKRITVEDSGEGISEEDLPNIFKRFYKAKTSKKSDSIGIGLALSKSIVESHNGIIEVHSQLGVGTKFTITFPKY